MLQCTLNGYYNMELIHHLVQHYYASLLTLVQDMRHMEIRFGKANYVTILLGLCLDKANGKNSDILHRCFSLK